MHLRTFIRHSLYAGSDPTRPMRRVASLQLLLFNASTLLSTCAAVLFLIVLLAEGASSLALIAATLQLLFFSASVCLMRRRLAKWASISAYLGFLAMMSLMQITSLNVLPIYSTFFFVAVLAQINMPKPSQGRSALLMVCIAGMIYLFHGINLMPSNTRLSSGYSIILFSLYSLLSAGYLWLVLYVMDELFKIRRGREDLYEKTSNKQLEEFRASLVRAFRDMSHDLRDTLNGIIPVLEQVERVGDNYVFSPLLYGALQSNSTHVVRMVENVLDWSKIEKGLVETLDFEETDPAAPAEIAVAIHQYDAMLKNINVSLTISSQPVCIQLDKTKTTRVISNLIKNSIKYCPQGSTISVHVNADAEYVRYTVSDNGPGIEHTKRLSLFEAFSSRDHRSTGTGLGLPIVKRLTSAMLGSVALDFPDTGGTHATVSIPYLTPESVAQFHNKQVSVNLPENLRVSVSGGNKKIHLNLLYVLSKLNVAYSSTETSSQALSLLSVNLPDALFVIQGNDQDLERNLLTLQNSPEFPALPVVFVHPYYTKLPDWIHRDGMMVDETLMYPYKLKDVVEKLSTIQTLRESTE